MENTLFNGAALKQQSFDDFVTRLKHDCVGKAVEDHSTADALFIVEKKVIVSGLDSDYTDQLGVYEDDCFHHSVSDFVDGLYDEEKEALNKWLTEYEHENYTVEDLIEEPAHTQKQTLSDFNNEVNWNLTPTGYAEEWRYVCSHFTKAAAERWIKRKKHDYSLGLRVFVDAQTYCWEFNAIKEALMSGHLVLADKAGNS